MAPINNAPAQLQLPLPLPAPAQPPVQFGAPLPVAEEGEEDGAPAPLGAAPVAAVAAAPAAGAAAPPMLYSMASAPLLGMLGAPRGPAARSPAARREAAHAANAHLRQAVCASLAHVDDLKLRFNCCGTGVEKVLLALGPMMRSQVAGLQWSYAKLGGPLYLKLLGSCTNLRWVAIRAVFSLLLLGRLHPPNCQQTTNLSSLIHAITINQWTYI
jgi:hypothetical protein